MKLPDSETRIACDFQRKLRNNTGWCLLQVCCYIHVSLNTHINSQNSYLPSLMLILNLFMDTKMKIYLFTHLSIEMTDALTLDCRQIYTTTLTPNKKSYEQ